jgi:endonuclease/exonuclease/phosphatase family metal-dependent hydrolase
MGIQARKEQGQRILEWIKLQSGPIVLMGDFNDAPESTVHQLLTGLGTGLQDTWQVLARGENAASMTHHDFKGIPEKTRLDWILVTRHFRVVDALIVRDNLSGRYPSDHFPYVAQLEWAHVADSK